jgi:hypothetical protein
MNCSLNATRGSIPYATGDGNGTLATGYRSVFVILATPASPPRPFVGKFVCCQGIASLQPVTHQAFLLRHARLQHPKFVCIIFSLPYLLTFLRFSFTVPSYCSLLDPPLVDSLCLMPVHFHPFGPHLCLLLFRPSPAAARWSMKGL